MMARRPKTDLKNNIANTGTGLGQTAAFSISPAEVMSLMDDMVDSAFPEPAVAFNPSTDTNKFIKVDQQGLPEYGADVGLDDLASGVRDALIPQDGIDNSQIKDATINGDEKLVANSLGEGALDSDLRGKLLRDASSGNKAQAMLINANTNAWEIGDTVSFSSTKLYQATGGDKPADPTSLNAGGGWVTTKPSPDATNTHVWEATGIGAGTISSAADIDEWLVYLVDFQSTGGGNTPTAQNHTIYVAYGIAGQTVFTAADATASGRSVNNGADTTQDTLTLPTLAAGQNRRYAIWVPSNKRITAIHLQGQNQNNLGGFPILGGVNPTIQQVGSPAQPHVVYVSEQIQNLSGYTMQVVTRDA